MCVSTYLGGSGHSASTKIRSSAVSMDPTPRVPRASNISSTRAECTPYSLRTVLRRQSVSRITWRFDAGVRDTYRKQGPNHDDTRRFARASAARRGAAAGWKKGQRIVRRPGDKSKATGQIYFLSSAAPSALLLYCFRSHMLSGSRIRIILRLDWTDRCRNHRRRCDCPRVVFDYTLKSYHLSESNTH